MDDTGGFLQETALHWAVRQGALEAVVELVKRDADPRLMGTEGMNALHLACIFKHLEVILYLCAAYPGLVHLETHREKGALTPLMLVVKHWTKPHHSPENAEKAKNILRALVAFGASVNAQCVGSGDSALHLAMRLRSDHDVRSVSQLLLEAGADPELENDSALTPESLARERPTPNAAKSITTHRMNKRVPSVLGFWTPWCQIFSAASFTQLLGWAFGCLSFFVACGVSVSCANLSKRSESRMQHGFAAGSIFMIVASGYYYLLPHVTPSFQLWYVVSVTLLVYFFVKTTISDPGYVELPDGHPRTTAAGLLVAAASLSSSSAGSASDNDAPSPSPAASVTKKKRPATAGDLEGMGDDMERGLLSRSEPASPHEMIVRLAERGELFGSQICCTCLIKRPRRSKHDPTCKRCVHRFDHFCPFVYTAIGRDNICYFMGFLLWCVLAIGSHLCVAIPYIWNLCGGGHPGWESGAHPDAAHPEVQVLDSNGNEQAESGDVNADLAQNLFCVAQSVPPALAVITGLACFHFLWILALLISQIVQICGDLTTYEAIRGYKERPSSGISSTLGRFVRVIKGLPTAGPLPPLGRREGSGM